MEQKEVSDLSRRDRQTLHFGEEPELKAGGEKRSYINIPLISYQRVKHWFFLARDGSIYQPLVKPLHTSYQRVGGASAAFIL